jgi:hypothetical protein
MQENARKVCDIREKVADGADSKTQRTSNFEGPNGILDLIQNVVDVGPSCIGVDDLERRRRILKDQIHLENTARRLTEEGESH